MSRTVGRSSGPSASSMVGGDSFFQSLMAPMMHDMEQKMYQKIHSKVADEIQQKFEKKHHDIVTKLNHRVNLLYKKSVQRMEQSGGVSESLKKQIPMLERTMKELVQSVTEQEEQRSEKNRLIQVQVQEAINKFKRNYHSVQQEINERKEKRARLMEALSDDMQSMSSFRGAITDELEEAAAMMGGGGGDNELLMEGKEGVGEGGLLNALSPLSTNDIIDNNDSLMSADMDAGEEYQTPRASTSRGGKRGRGGRGRGGRRAR